MPLSDTLRTSHFRTAAYFLAVFALSSAALLGYVYWQTSFYLAHEVDRSLHANVQRWSQLPPEALLREVSGRLRRDPSLREPAVLIGGGGERVAGAFELVGPVPRYDAPFDAEQYDAHGNKVPVRALASVLGSGLVLVIGRDVHDLDEFDERIRTAMVGGIFIVLGVGLAGAFALGARARRRLDDMAHSLQSIVEGHLGARLPVRNSRDDLDRIAALVNAMLDEIERLMGEVKGVTDDVAHDLRTPLTRMLAGLDRAQAGTLSREELSALVDDTADDARLLLRMFKGLLRISEIENSARRENFETLDLTVIAGDAVELFEPAAQELGVALRFVGCAMPVILRGDPDLLFDAFANLIDNAIKFAPPGTDVTVQVAQEAGQIQAMVTDAGPGIPEEERGAVLRRFYRSEKSRHTPGHGLGLSLVAAIARLHGMALTIGDAQPGCRITLTLPPATPT
ncbi:MULTISPECIES: HAMP domain-containing sensor histidine kinase [unclassified Acidovorax]|uniref:HAMP domain-containing sensor histidine kinase n=1 Tax=unclassified Acidovorax TaxID=2684926 RepID=UPI0023DE6AD9|nr:MULTISPECIES: HAMP domain-containing sensor histidine kinase [unclassified Acidovorax]GKS92832.1 HAMP domain-containing protein [Acidovorax sp. SUPP2539]GKS97564.1 HAMP domain-containing protein [Acidovorax sp. SUPP2825]